MEEENLWELDDDWASDISSEVSDSSLDEEAKASPSAPETKAPDPEPSQSTAQRDPESEKNAPAAEKNPAPESAATENPIDAPQPSSEAPVSTTDTVSPDRDAPSDIDESAKIEESDSESDPSAEEETPPAKVSIIEKVALALIAVLFLGLAASGYLWLYEKNHIADNTKISYPVQGQHLTITACSTYWTTASAKHETKIGAAVLPSARITLGDGGSGSGALRIHFYNVDDAIIGDTITLSVEGGRFVSSDQPNIIVAPDGRSASIVASDGFHQEGDFSAYVLDPKLAWKMHISEAPSASASGSTFTNILKTKVDPKRQ